MPMNGRGDPTARAGSYLDHRLSSRARTLSMQRPCAIGKLQQKMRRQS